MAAVRVLAKTELLRASVVVSMRVCTCVCVVERANKNFILRLHFCLISLYALVVVVVFALYVI